jgi:hypothetical protein
VLESRSRFQGQNGTVKIVPSIKIDGLYEAGLKRPCLSEWGKTSHAHERFCQLWTRAIVFMSNFRSTGESFSDRDSVANSDLAKDDVLCQSQKRSVPLADGLRLFIICYDHWKHLHLGRDETLRIF